MDSSRRLQIVLLGAVISFLGGTFPKWTQAQETFTQTLPNILWITSEDNSAHWLGCYGNGQAHTPRLDALAKESVLFENAYSNAPVCAVARSTILHGAYAVSTGTQHMRSRHRIPESFKPYVSYLRELGYYCTNRSKTDYNRAGNDKEIWDACGGKAHYKNRQHGQPFFAIFNLTVTHESNLFPEKVAKNRRQGTVPTSTRISAAEVALPPYLPDLPEIREDIARYHDCMTALDTQIGKLLDELENRGLAEDTIVFYYADHGGATPRGKRYLTDTGVRIPMIVHVPEKWSHLSSFSPGERTGELVAFVDLAPTLLSLCGQSKPEQMQGRAFLGSQREEPGQEPVVFLFADRFDELYGMRRGITDGQFKYLRRFKSHLPAAPCSNYSLGQPGWAAWMKAWQTGQLESPFNRIWEPYQPVEELYDLKADPWEVKNLAGDPKHATRLKKYRARLQQEMQAVQDTGVIPEPMFAELLGGQTICDYVRSDYCDLEQLIKFAFTASAGQTANMPTLFAMMKDKNPVVRYWGAMGCTILGEQAAELSPHLVSLGEDESACVRMTAARALWAVGKEKAAADALLREFEKEHTNEGEILLTNLATQMDLIDRIPRAWIDQVLADESASVYFRRFVDRITK